MELLGSPTAVLDLVSLEGEIKQLLYIVVRLDLCRTNAKLERLDKPEIVVDFYFVSF